MRKTRKKKVAIKRGLRIDKSAYIIVDWKCRGGGGWTTPPPRVWLGLKANVTVIVIDFFFIVPIPGHKMWINKNTQTLVSTLETRLYTYSINNYS